MRTCGIKKCSFKFDQGEQGTDSASMFVSVEKKNAYLNYNIFGYMVKPNLLDYHLRIDRLMNLEENNKMKWNDMKLIPDFTDKLQNCGLFKNGLIGFNYNYAKMAG